jgi:hypothetical protein
MPHIIVDVKLNSHIFIRILTLIIENTCCLVLDQGLAELLFVYGAHVVSAIVNIILKTLNILQPLSLNFNRLLCPQIPAESECMDGLRFHFV